MWQDKYLIKKKDRNAQQHHATCKPTRPTHLCSSERNFYKRIFFNPKFKSGTVFADFHDLKPKKRRTSFLLLKACYRRGGTPVLPPTHKRRHKMSSGNMSILSNIDKCNSIKQYQLTFLKASWHSLNLFIIFLVTVAHFLWLSKFRLSEFII